MLTDEENADQVDNVTVSLVEWAFHFEEMKNTLYKQKLKEQEDLARELRRAIFPNSNIVVVSAVAGTDTKNTKKRKRKQPSTSIVSSRPRTKLVTLKLKTLRLKKLVTLKSNRLHTVISNGSTNLADPANPTTNSRPALPAGSTSAIAYDKRVRELHEQGTVVITPCQHCFTSLQQCVKTNLSGSCWYCSHIHRACQGAIEMGKWVDRDGKRVPFFLFSVGQWGADFLRFGRIVRLKKLFDIALRLI